MQCPYSLVIVLITIALLLKFIQTWMQGPKCTSKRRLDGKVVVITGANTGIGKECARELSRRGAKVIMLVRSLERGEVAAREIRGEGGDIIVEKMDLSSFTSIRECASKLNVILDKINILLNNAGVMACPLTRTEDGLEMQIGTNHFGHFLLTNLLLPLLKKGGPGTRVVTVSSIGHTRGKIHWEDMNFDKNLVKYGRLQAYRQSKVANILFSNELARRVVDFGIHTYSLHPGAINTDLLRHLSEKLGIMATASFSWFIQPFLKVFIEIVFLYEITLKLKYMTTFADC